MLYQAKQNSMFSFRKGSFRITKSLSGFAVYMCLSVLITEVQCTIPCTGTGYKRCSRSRNRPRSQSVGSTRHRSRSRRPSSVNPHRHARRVTAIGRFPKNAERKYEVMEKIALDFKNNGIKGHEFEIYAGQDREALKFKASKLTLKHATDGYQYYDQKGNIISIDDYESCSEFSLYHTYTLEYEIPGKSSSGMIKNIKDYVEEHKSSNQKWKKKRHCFALKFDDMPLVEEVCSEKDLKIWKKWNKHGVFPELRNVLRSDNTQELLVWKVKTASHNGNLAQFNKLDISYCEKTHRQTLCITFQHVKNVEKEDRPDRRIFEDLDQARLTMQRIKNAVSVKEHLQKAKQNPKRNETAAPKPVQPLTKRLLRAQSYQPPIHEEDEVKQESNDSSFDNQLEGMTWTPRVEMPPTIFRSPSPEPDSPSKDQSEEPTRCPQETNSVAEASLEHSLENEPRSGEPTAEQCPHIFGRLVSFDSTVHAPPIRAVKPEAAVVPPCSKKECDTKHQSKTGRVLEDATQGQRLVSGETEKERLEREKREKRQKQWNRIDQHLKKRRKGKRDNYKHRFGKMYNYNHEFFNWRIKPKKPSKHKGNPDRVSQASQCHGQRGREDTDNSSRAIPSFGNDS